MSFGSFIHLFTRSIKTHRLIFLLSAATIVFSIAFYDNWQPPQELLGSWSTRGPAVIRYSKGFLSYQFFKDTVDVKITIHEDGTVSGSIGNAVLADCRVYENRGWFGRLFNLATDYVIKGKLSGSMFAKDTIAEKEISAPFNLKNDKIKGSCFNMCGFDFYPFAPFDLERKSAEHSSESIKTPLQKAGHLMKTLLPEPLEKYYN